MIDFNKPLALTDKHTGLIKQRYEVSRVLCSDRVCPAGYRHVVLIRNKEAMFGDEEFVETVNDEGVVGGRIGGRLINIGSNEQDEKLIKDLIPAVNQCMNLWFYGDRARDVAIEIIGRSDRDFWVLKGSNVEGRSPSGKAQYLQNVIEEAEADNSPLFIDFEGLNEAPFDVNILFGPLMKGIQIIGAGKPYGMRMSAQLGNRITHVDLDQMRK